MVFLRGYKRNIMGKQIPGFDSKHKPNVGTRYQKNRFLGLKDEQAANKIKGVKTPVEMHAAEQEGTTTRTQR